MGRKRNVITTKETSLQEKLDRIESSLIFVDNEVWTTPKLSALLVELCGNKETKEETEERMIAAFWRWHAGRRSRPQETYWAHLIDGAEWTKNTLAAAGNKKLVKLPPIVDRESLNGWVKVVRAGNGHFKKIRDSLGELGVHDRSAHVMVIEGAVRYLRQAEKGCNRVEEFCDTLIETGLLETGAYGNKGLDAILRYWDLILKKAGMDEYSSLPLPRHLEDEHTVLLHHYAPTWLAFLDTLSHKLHSTGKVMESEQIRLLIETGRFMVGRQDGVSDYALHLWYIFKETGPERLAEILNNGIKLAWWSDNKERSGLVFLEALYREVSRLFRAEAGQFCTEAESGKICKRFERLFKSKNEKCLHGRYLVAIMALLTTAGKGTASRIGFYSAFEDCVCDWVLKLGKYRRDLQDITYLQEEVIYEIRSAWSEGGPLWPYEQTWSVVRRQEWAGIEEQTDFSI